MEPEIGHPPHRRSWRLRRLLATFLPPRTLDLSVIRRQPDAKERWLDETADIFRGET